MSILNVIIMAGIAAVIGQLQKRRSITILAASAVLIYWLDPRINNPSANYWLPTLTLALAVLSWAITAPQEARTFRRNWLGFVILFVVSLLFSLNRYMGYNWLFDPNVPRPPYVVGAFLLLFVVTICLLLLIKFRKLNQVFLIIASVGIIGILLLIKFPELAGLVHKGVLRLAGVSEEYKPFYLGWLGYSYVAFRLLHTYFDKRAGRLPSMALDEYVSFVIFFPSFTAGPIDRIERFLAGLRSRKELTSEDWLFNGKRFFLGLFKKFVLADGLALISLDAYSKHIPSPLWAWALLYIYAFRLLFDFSGYTDIAIGLGGLMGIHLPENFDSPYLKPNLTTFWNSWHMSLTQWFRAYVFNPLARWFRSRKKPVPTFIVIVIGQILTMLLIGMWHGITINYILWGMYHALGLIIANRWSEWTRKLKEKWTQKHWVGKVFNITGIVLTFNIVAIGWLFFALRTPSQVLDFVKSLLGVI